MSERDDTEAFPSPQVNFPTAGSEYCNDFYERDVERRSGADVKLHKLWVEPADDRQGRRESRTRAEKIENDFIYRRNLFQHFVSSSVVDL